MCKAVRPDKQLFISLATIVICPVVFIWGPPSSKHHKGLRFMLLSALYQKGKVKTRELKTLARGHRGGP